MIFPCIVLFFSWALPSGALLLQQVSNVSDPALCLTTTISDIRIDSFDPYQTDIVMHVTIPNDIQSRSDCATFSIPSSPCAQGLIAFNLEENFPDHQSQNGYSIVSYSGDTDLPVLTSAWQLQSCNSLKIVFRYLPYEAKEMSGTLTASGTVGVVPEMGRTTSVTEIPIRIDIPFTINAGSSAKGDPHLQNIHGERFDLMKPGRHVLINIPRGERAQKAVLRVEAEVRRIGGLCKDMYIQELNITGSWADEKRSGGYHYDSEVLIKDTPKWLVLGQVELKVANGRTEHGVNYFNVYVNHLGRAGLPVGGLLGEDDHSVAATPSAACEHLVDLQSRSAGVHGQSSLSVSIAVASLA